MPRPKTVYRGKRKYSWLITLLVSTLALLLLLTVWMFYHLQTYLVYDKDGVRLVLPSERETLTPSELPSGWAKAAAPSPTACACWPCPRMCAVWSAGAS